VNSFEASDSGGHEFGERGKANARGIDEDKSGGITLRVRRVDIVTTARRKSIGCFEHESHEWMQVL
jgi:hypothetical protein